jgi:hypothetical protein
MEFAIVVIVVLAAVAAVLYPLLRRGTEQPFDAPEPAPPDDEALEAEIARYREALRAGTLCRRCGEPNPAGARFCANCGRRLEPKPR